MFLLSHSKKVSFCVNERLMFIKRLMFCCHESTFTMVIKRLQLDIFETKNSKLNIKSIQIFVSTEKQLNTTTKNLTHHHQIQNKNISHIFFFSLCLSVKSSNRIFLCFPIDCYRAPSLPMCSCNFLQWRRNSLPFIL